MTVTQAQRAVAEKLGDEDLVRLARGRDEAAVRAITSRYNRRLFRIARSIVRDDGEAEDVVQETYVRAFTGLETFRGDAAFGTWITRIAMNEALGRLRRQRPTVDWETYGANRDEAEIINFPLSAVRNDPEKTMAQGEVRAVLERAIAVAEQASAYNPDILRLGRDLYYNMRGLSPAQAVEESRFALAAALAAEDEAR